MSTRALKHKFLLWWIGILGVLPPLLLGSVHTRVQILFITAGFLSFLAALLLPSGSKRISVTYTLWFALGISLFSLFQIIPLPLSLLGLLSPAKTELLTRLEFSGNFYPISYAVPETILNIAKLLSYAGVAFLTYHFAKRYRVAKNIIYIIAFSGAFIAVTALLHPVLGLDSIFGFYTPVETKSFFAPFVNSNNASGYYLFILFLLAGIIYETPNPRLKYITVIATVIVFSAILMTGSRAGIFIIPIGLTIWIYLFKKQNFNIDTNITKIVIPLIIIILSIPLMDLYVTPFLAGSRLPGADTKMLIWKDSLSVIHAHINTGIGKGSFQTVFPHYMQTNQHLLPHFSENIILQQFIDFGIPFAILIFITAFLPVFSYIRNIKMKPWQTGALTAAIVLLIQNIFDFNLYFPGTAFPFFIVIGALEAMRKNTRTKIKKYKKVRLTYVWIVALVIISLTTFSLFKYSLPNLDENQHRILADLSESGQIKKLHDKAVEFQKTHPSDAFISAARAYAEIFIPKGRPLKWVGIASWIFPLNYYPELMAGRILLKMGKLSQAKLQYQRAVLKGAPLKWALLKETMRIWKKNNEYLEIYPLSKLPSIVSLLPAKDRVSACNYMLENDYPTKRCILLLSGYYLKNRQYDKLEVISLYGLAFQKLKIHFYAALLQALWMQNKQKQFNEVLLGALKEYPSVYPFRITYGLYLYKRKSPEKAEKYLLNLKSSARSLSERWYAGNALLLLYKTMNRQYDELKLDLYRMKKIGVKPAYRVTAHLLAPVWHNILPSHSSKPGPR